MKRNVMFHARLSEEDFNTLKLFAGKNKNNLSEALRQLIKKGATTEKIVTSNYLNHHESEISNDTKNNI